METRLDTRLVCPPELSRPAPERPVPSADAVVRFNDAGRRFLEALAGWGESAAARLADAREACAASAAESGR